MHNVIYTLVPEYGYVLFFVLLFAGIIGFPFPDEGLLLFAGGLLAKGMMSIVPLMISSLSAVFLGATFNFWFARYLCFRSSNTRGKNSMSLLQRYGFWAIPISYFIPGVRIGVSYSAGILLLRPGHFYLAAFLGAICWISVYLWIGYSFMNTDWR